MREHFDRPETKRLLAKLRRAGVRLEARAEERRASAGPLAGTRLVVTGTLASMSREEAVRRVVELGGEVGSSVSKGTDWLVVGDRPGSKLARARSLGVATLDEAASSTCSSGQGSDAGRSARDAPGSRRDPRRRAT